LFKESIKFSNEGSDGNEIIDGQMILDWQFNRKVWYVVESGTAIRLVSGKQFAVHPCISMPAEAIRMPHVHSMHYLGQSEKIVMIQSDTCGT